MITQTRVQAGVPAGGQFAATQHAEADLELTDDAPAADDRDWGDVSNVNTGSRSPWGQVQYANHPAPGIVSVGTAGHGGIKLSPQRNAEIPPPLRNRSGWYEEDVESTIVGMYHPDAFPFLQERMGDDDLRGDMEMRVRANFPDRYEKATGKTVPPEHSWVLRDRQKAADVAAFRAEHANEFVTLHRGEDDHGDWVPEGYRPMAARKDATGEVREFLVPYDECVENGSFVSNRRIDPNRHIDVTGIGKLGDPPSKVDGPKLTGEQLGIDYSGLSSAARDRAYSELNRRYRFRDDNGGETVETYAEHLARVGVVGKHEIGDDGYFVEYGNSSVSKVTKATFDALTGVPDTATDTDRANGAYRKALGAYDRARDKARSTWGSERAAADKRAAAAAARLEDSRAARDAAEEARKAREGTWEDRQQMRKAAFAQLLAERGIELD